LACPAGTASPARRAAGCRAEAGWPAAVLYRRPACPRPACRVL